MSGRIRHKRKTPSPSVETSTIDDSEIAHFSAHAGDWWELHGTYAPLHKMARARMEFLTAQLGNVKGKSILDIGCGGGLVCEPLARLGANVTGIDADQNAVRIAKDHAEKQNLTIDYQCAAAEDLAANGEQFDCVTALEILEHVMDAQVFVDLCARLVKPEGKVVFSTLNRTWKSYALGIIAAERVLNWAPVGTHQWRKFIRPSELAAMCESAGLKPAALSGVVYRPLHGDFTLDPHDLGINYFLVATKP